MVSHGVVIWQCSENPKHRGWRDESNPDENMKRGTCDTCLAMTAFEREVIVAGEEYTP